LPQELDAQALDAMRSELRALDHKQLGHVCQLIGAQGTAPGQVLESQLWSPGEAKKVAIALALARRVWGLILDEPENHLDLPSVERLEELLGTFPGALLLVSHDETLARRATTQRWRMRDGTLEVG
jgi:ATPase subunit of ABC transporter with duplicated ATPase domains